MCHLGNEILKEVDASDLGITTRRHVTAELVVSQPLSRDFIFLL
jgi:hypothetical protein